jgi:hypothetical protein
MAEGSSRFPPPWRADKIPGGYVVRDANGQAIASSILATPEGVMRARSRAPAAKHTARAASAWTPIRGTTSTAGRARECQRRRGGGDQ